MSTNQIESAEKKLLFTEGIEPLNVTEMFHIRGGLSDEKGRTKEIDIYDNREG